MSNDQQTAGLVALRRQVRASLTKPEMARRVYNLPTGLLERLLCEQARRNLPSETHAARVLLDEALTKWEGRANG